MLPPITEEDKPALVSVIVRLVRMRKREHAHGKRYLTELDDAIKELIRYGMLKGWWEDSDPWKW